MTDHRIRHEPSNPWRLTPEPFPPLPVCWATLSDDETAEEHEALADWIAWLADRYLLDYRTVPPCWVQHGALIEELSALRVHWLASYALTARPEAPLEWHAHFAAARQRLADWVARTGCRPGEHRAAR
jgi:hypothetical protein